MSYSVLFAIKLMEFVASECSDVFFPVCPTFAVYILGNQDADGLSYRTRTDSSFATVDVGVESAIDVHLRNLMILQTYPQHLYFYSLRPLSLSISSYDEFRWIQEHQDYSRLKQRCRQKFLQETDEDAGHQELRDSD